MTPTVSRRQNGRKNMSALSKYEEKLRVYPARGAGLHSHIMSVACLGVLAEIPPEQIISDMNASFNGIRPNEAAEAVSKAAKTEYKDTYVAPEQTGPQLTIDQFIGDHPLDMMELIEASPVRLLNDTDGDGVLLLETLYKPDEYLFIGDVYDKEVKQVRDWLNGCNFPHIIPNPMTGELGTTGNGTQSFRCEETVADLRYAVCEMDDVPIAKQVGFWLKCISIGIPVSAVIHSGKKSLHGWVRVDCGTDHAKWDADVRGWLFNQFGAKYGLDKACATKARLSRMAGHYRDCGEQQRLLYLGGK